MPIGDLPISSGPISGGSDAAGIGGGSGGGGPGGGTVTPPDTGFEYELWVNSIPIDGLLLGPADCEAYNCDDDLPGEDCLPEGMELIVEYRELLDPLAYFDDDPGEWVRFDECCWGGSGVTCLDLCDMELPALVTVNITSSNPDCCLVGTYVLPLNGADCDGWALSLGTFCGYGDTIMNVAPNAGPPPRLDFNLQSLGGSISISIELEGDCETFEWSGTGSAGGYCTGDDITVTVARGTPSGCEVWGLMRWLNIPESYTIGDEECTYAPEECCLGDPIRLSDIDGDCEWSYDCEINRRLYLHLYDGEWECPIGGTPSGTSPDQTIILDYNPGAPGVDPYWGGQFNCDLLDPDSSDCSLIECVEPGYITLTPLCDTTATDVCPLLTLDACDEPVQWWKITVTAGASPSCGAQDYAYIFCTPCNTDPLLMMPTQFTAWSTPPGAGSFCYLATKILAICGTRFSNYSVMISE